jgi:hypothetical protein
MELNFDGGLTVACAATLALAAVAALRHGRRWWDGYISSPRRPLEPAGSAAAARMAHVAFWSVAGILPALAFVLTSVPVDRNSARYVVSVGFAIFALVPLAAMLRGTLGRALLTAGVCVLATGGIASLVRQDIQDNLPHFPTGAQSGPLLRFARAERIKYGYAGYWDAAPLSWQTRTELQLYPVSGCLNGPSVCPFGLHRISSWYTPRPHTRTMFVKDHALPDSPDPPKLLGRPERKVEMGQITVYVFPYDIASRFGRDR